MSGKEQKIALTIQLTQKQRKEFNKLILAVSTRHGELHSPSVIFGAMLALGATNIDLVAQTVESQEKE